MMHPSAERTSVVTVAVYMPIIRGGSFIRTIDNEIASYSHVISVDGGFKSASIDIKVPMDLMDDWLMNGHGRHMVSHGAGGETVWEGFVDGVSASMGGLTIERGKLTTLCNRCSATYTPIIDETTDPPVTGATTETVIVEDTDSQAKYGIWEQIISAGTVLQADAEYARDTFLEENRELEVSHQISLGGESSGDITVNLDCKGYIEWLNNYAYNYTDTPLSVEASTKIEDVIEADPNNIISTDLGEIDYNGILVSNYEDQNRMGLSIINEIVTMGDINDLRWTFGIYENRIPYYKATPTDIEYLHYTTTGSQRILNLAYGEISPWNIRPGKICIIPDIIIGRASQYTDIRRDPRIMFIEQVSYSAPNGIELQGQKIRKYDQLMARLGLAGA